MERHSRIRVSDADREGIVARLGVATSEGRLTVDEFSERAQLAYASRTWGELSRLVDDLPRPVIARPPYQAPPAAPSRIPLLALIFGLLAVPTSACVPLGAPLSVAAVVLGVLGIRGGDRGMAVIGLITGLLGLILQVVLVVFFAAASVSSDLG